MKIMQIVGYKNSGKTTLINELIQICNAHQLEVTTIKHHGHGEEDISLNHKEVDSRSFINSGASESIVLGHQLIERVTKQQKSLTQIIEEDLSIKPDVILVEGFKQEQYPKVLLKKNSGNLNQELANVLYELDAFHEGERQLFLKWFKNWLEIKK